MILLHNRSFLKIDNPAFGRNNYKILMQLHCMLNLILYVLYFVYKKLKCSAVIVKLKWE